MHDSGSYADNAERCRVEAAAATLDNVRERCLRAEAAWTALGARSSRTEASRAARKNESELAAAAT